MEEERLRLRERDNSGSAERLSRESCARPRKSYDFRFIATCEQKLAWRILGAPIAISEILTPREGLPQGARLHPQSDV